MNNLLYKWFSKLIKIVVVEVADEVEKRIEAKLEATTREIDELFGELSGLIEKYKMITKKLQELPEDFTSELEETTLELKKIKKAIKVLIENKIDELGDNIPDKKAIEDAYDNFKKFIG